MLDNQKVIVFDNPLASQLQNLTTQELLSLIRQTEWVNPYVYNQPIDVAVKSDDTNLIYSVREAGSYERKEGFIMGIKAYKFTNRIFTEKYAPFETLLDKLINANTSVNLLSGMGITNPENYNIISTSPYFLVNNGILTLPRPNIKPSNNYGIIYFLPKSANLPIYRMRVFTHRPDQTIIDRYFDNNGNLSISRASYLTDYYCDKVNMFSPFVLYVPISLTGGRVADACRTPPPTAGSEDSL